MLMLFSNISSVKKLSASWEIMTRSPWHLNEKIFYEPMNQSLKTAPLKLQKGSMESYEERCSG